MNKKEKPSWGFYRLPEVLDVLSVSRSTFLAGVKRGKYPAPVKLSERCTAWRVGEIRECAERLGR